MRLKRLPKFERHPQREYLNAPEDYARLLAKSVDPPARIIANLPREMRAAEVARAQVRIYDQLLRDAPAPRRSDGGEAMTRDELSESLSMSAVPRNQPRIALEVLQERQRHQILRDEHIQTALKLQDDRTELVAAIRSLGLKPNDPTDDW